jgi:hypothetical protein
LGFRIIYQQNGLPYIRLKNASLIKWSSIYKTPKYSHGKVFSHTPYTATEKSSRVISKEQRPFFGLLLKFGQVFVDATFVQKISKFQ